jgi:L-amino acid N-acyltransferase YncA
LRKIFYQVIVENKTHGLGEETVFDFKYIPNYSTTTELGEYEISGHKETGIEKRNLRTLIVASTVVAVLSYLGMRTTWGIVGGLRAWWGV